MSAIFSSWMLVIAGILTILAVFGSPNFSLWLVCVVALPIAVWLLGGKKAYRVLLWLIGILWLEVIGDVIAADLKGEIIFNAWLGPYQAKAIIFSLCAITVLAIGMRVGKGMGGWPFLPVVYRGTIVSVGNDRILSFNRIVLCYFVSLILVQVLGTLAYITPALTQPLLALASIKFVFIYLIAARTFESERGYIWLILVLFLETAIGLTGYFSGYKEAFFIMLIAMASSSRAPSIRVWILGITAVLMVVWVSVVWTTSKKEYRHFIARYPIEQRAEWMAHRFLTDKIDYSTAFKDMFGRIGYTHYFSMVIARQENGSLPSGFSFYFSAVQNVLKPRFLFPDKAALNDSKITTKLLGVHIDPDTSIGVGYIAQAYVDFGVPGFLVPMFLIGLMLGAAAKYFMTRSAPLMIREAFATASLFLSVRIEANIDKAFGGFLIGCLAMGVAFKYGYPAVARWLENRHPERPDPARVSFVN
jgi:hypothetical protein